jgi:hypothetical protein
MTTLAQNRERPSAPATPRSGALAGGDAQLHVGLSGGKIVRRVEDREVPTDDLVRRVSLDVPRRRSNSGSGLVSRAKMA